jgi:hypothetical protein
MVNRLRPAAGLALALLVLPSCSSQKNAAAALRQAEEAITAQHAEALRYAPDAFRQVMAVYDSARRSLDSGDYRAASRFAEDAAERARNLPTAIAAGREAMQPRWGEVHGNLSLIVSSLERRLKEVDSTGRRPAGATAAQVSRARAALDTIRAGLRNAAADWQRGDRAEAIQTAERLQGQGLQALELLGVRMGPHGLR